MEPKQRLSLEQLKETPEYERLTLEATFDDVDEGVRKRMKEIAVLTFEGGLISSLREYWASEELGIVERVSA